MYHIGILQLTQNLDDAVQGFKSGCAELGLPAEFYYKNADGNLTVLPELAANLADLKVDLIFACSTPAAVAAAGLDGSIPVVFTPVFDPIGAGLVTSLEHPGGKLTGVAGMVKADAKVAFIHRLLPTAQKLGIVYHETDSNSLLELKHFRQAADPSFHVVEIPIQRPEELSQLAEMLSPDLDALFLPIGKIVEDNFATIVYYADAVSLPIITSHAPNVAAGALGALVANHRQLGHDCAAKAARILNGTAPGDIAISIVKQPEIWLNHFAAQNLGITLSADLLSEATEVFE
ncbi:MAG: transporter substrate binding protein [Anaerosporomusa subterranea]|nr:transporter substrate binding protein [Anaerosporomusa subterranea]